MTDQVPDAKKKVIDLDALEKLADEAEACSPSPWQHTPSTRTVHGNESGYLADREGNWIATFDGREENDFSASADPATIKALIAELREARGLLKEALDDFISDEVEQAIRAFLARNGKGEG